MKRAAVYSPYLETLGGGEKYVVAMMTSLLAMGYEVDLLWSSKEILGELSLRYDVDISKIRVNIGAYTTYTKGTVFSRMLVSSTYDAFVFVSDGSIPFLFSKKNVVHFQVPFKDLRSDKLLGLKRILIRHVICNSKFTKQFIDKTYGFASDVVYPPVTQIHPKQKESYILSVGRFDNLLNAKRQDVLIKAFKQMNQKGWKLVLAGGCQHGADYLRKLREQAHALPVEIIENPRWAVLESLFAKATIYWHAAGYGIDLELHPEQAEHFGIAIAEAMSAKSVPVVYNGGGISEIVTHGSNGFLWSDVDELVAYTKQLIQDGSLRKKLAEVAHEKAKDYSWETFEDAFERAIG